MEELIPWIWALMALIFIVAEIFTAGFFIICFGIGAAAATLVAFLGFSPVWQMVIFILVSGIAVFLSRPIAARISGSGSNSVGIDRVLHKEAIVTVAVEPLLARGRVRVEREEWLAESEDGQPIPAGATVKVIGVEGTRLKVQLLSTQ